MPSADSHNKTLITDLSNPESILSFNRLGVLLIFFFSMIQFHWTQFQSGLDLTPGDLGDPRFVNIILEHGYQWLIGESNTSFWSPEWNFYPQQHTLTQSEVMIGSMISYAPYRLIGINPFASFQYFIITCSILNFVTAFLLARSLKISSIGSALAASIFAYGLCRSGFTPHPQLLAHWWTPLGIYLGIKSLHLSTKYESSDIKLKKFYFFSKSNTFAALAGICFSLQFWSAFYLGFFCAIATIAIGSFLLLFQFKSTINHIKTYYIQGLVFLFAAGMTISPLAFAYFETARNFGTRPDYVVIKSMPKIVAWLTPPTSSLFYSWLYKLNEGAHNNHMEFSIFQGSIPTFCFIFGIAYCLRNRRNTNPLIYNCIFTMAAIILFFTRIGQDTIWKFFLHLTPGATAIRSMARIGLLMLLPSGILTAAIYDKIALYAKQRISQDFMMIGFSIIFILFTLSEQIDKKDLFFSIQHSTKRIDDLKIMAEATCRNKPIVIQTEGPYTYVEEIDIMWASILTGIPSIIGYSGLVHPKYAENKIGSIEMTIDSLKAWLRFFDKEGDYCLLKSTKAQSSTN